MIDNRSSKVFDHDIDENLQSLSDTSIVLNFQKAIADLYPHLIPIHAFGYNAFDDIVMPLFYEMVYNTFSYKHGIEINGGETHIYRFSLRCYKGINHIACLPKEKEIDVLINEEWTNMSEQEWKDKSLVFKAFGDGVYNPGGGLEVEEAKNVNFNLVEVDIISNANGRPAKSGVFVHKEAVEFEFVAETYDENFKH
ncbi:MULTISPECIES: hypothetical protein [Niallia]|uniref:Uncharacterized protein n=1 Tax=Niallia circulans TaxID=1397 RepID=A0A553ST74_NIACI|nr:hypothetical protein [Niallia circulans]TRZ40151.1 hypothetical protein CEQ21_04210 [Niallia circulans]